MGSDEMALTESAMPIGIQAPRAARIVVARCLGEQVPASVLDAALLLVSEMVSNSVRHSGARDGEDVVLRVQLGDDRCRLEVQDPGRSGVVAPRPLDLGKGALGLHLVDTLSERWGVVRDADGPTRVWAQLSCAAA